MHVLIIVNRRNPGKEGAILGGGLNYGMEKVYHFVSYIPKNGFIWELDSLRRNPTKLAAINEGKNWLEFLRPIIMEKLDSVSHRATLLAIVKDPIAKKDEQVGNPKASCEDLNGQQSQDVTNHDKPNTSDSPSASNPTPIINKTEQEEKDVEEINIQPTDIVVDILDKDLEMFFNLSILNGPLFPPISNTSTFSTESGTDLTTLQYTSETYTTKEEDKALSPKMNKRKLIDDVEAEGLKKARVKHRRNLFKDSKFLFLLKYK